MPLRRMWFILICLFAAPFALLRAQEAPAEGVHPPVRIVILHTNDLHGQILPFRNTHPRPGEPEEIGGFAVLAAAINKTRTEAEAAGVPVVLVDAGDFFQGTPEGDLPNGRLVVDLFNLMCYDAITLGNHDFDQGQDNLRQLLERSQAPMLSANLHLAGDRAYFPRAEPYIIKEVGGIRIAFVGLILHDLAMVCSKKAVAGLVVRDEAATLQTLIPELRRQGADLIIPINHCGIETDKVLAAQFSEIPLIIGGHSHTAIENTYRDAGTGTVVVQTGAKCRNLGRVDLTVDFVTRRVTECETKLLPLRKDLWGEDGSVSEAIEKATPEIRATMAEELGESAEEMTTRPEPGSGLSSRLGNWITDVMRESAGVDVALTNRSGIRSTMPKGKLTRRDLYQISPFGNTIAKVNLTGEQLRGVIEFALNEGTRHILEISGATLVVDLSKPVGERVVEMTVGDTTLDRARTYRVCTNSFLAQGGDHQEIFTQGQDPEDTGVTVLDATIERVKGHSPVKAEPSPRIRAAE